MILGDICTRACGYCAVAHGRPTELDCGTVSRRRGDRADAACRRGHHLGRPRRPEGRRRLDLRRNDPADARPRARLPDRGPDPRFPGHRVALRTVLDAGRTCSTTISRRSRGCTAWRAPADGISDRSSCSTARGAPPEIATKTGIMVGLGEQRTKSWLCLRGPAQVGVSILTIGQYLRPSLKHAADGALLPSRRVRAAESPGPRRASTHVESGPLVRSSYHAHEQADAYVASQQISLKDSPRFTAGVARRCA